MKFRTLGRPQNPRVMRMSMFCFRLCLAAHFSDDRKNAETVLGPTGIKLKQVFERTATSDLVLKFIVKDSDRLMGVGGNSIVMRASGSKEYIHKYNYVLAGTDTDILEQLVVDRQQMIHELETHFQDLAVVTEYRISQLPARYPMGKLTTLCLRQPQVRDKIDLFSNQAQILISDPIHKQLRRDLRRLIHRTEAWATKNKWLDIIGPENIVITSDSGQPRIRIIDTEPYAPEYMQYTNPVLGKTYQAVFMERLSAMKSMANSN